MDAIFLFRIKARETEKASMVSITILEGGFWKADNVMNRKLGATRLEDLYSDQSWLATNAAQSRPQETTH
jgi:hypothetical protein